MKEFWLTVKLFYIVRMLKKVFSTSPSAFSYEVVAKTLSFSSSCSPREIRIRTFSEWLRPVFRWATLDSNRVNHFYSEQQNRSLSVLFFDRWWWLAEKKRNRSEASCSFFTELLQKQCPFVLHLYLGDLDEPAHQRNRCFCILIAQSTPMMSHYNISKSSSDTKYAM